MKMKAYINKLTNNLTNAQTQDQLQKVWGKIINDHSIDRYDLADLRGWKDICSDRLRKGEGK